MISSFWNLCRACPSVPVEKLHSEYRSTFQWHEFVGSKADSAAVTHHAVVRQPSQVTKPHVFWSGGRGGAIEEERKGKRVNITNINNSANAANGWWLRSSTTDSIRPQKAQPKKHTKLETQLPPEEGAGGPKKSLSMGTIRAFETIVPQTHTLANVNHNNPDASVTLAGLDSQLIMDSAKGLDSLNWTEHKNMSASYESGKPAERQDNRKEYKSEYKKQFRPFSQYEYVDGKFFKKQGDHEANPWYKEVIELRKKAGEYRYRGWGTELVPQHLADVYHQNVWDQVSRRSSLAALALITTTTQKSISKEEKDKENARKSYPKRSLSRPNTATPKHPISDLKRDSETVQGAKKKYDGAPSLAGRVARGKARSQSAGPGGQSPRKATRQSVLSKERDLVDSNSNKPQQRHPRPSSADPSMGFSEPVIKSPPEPTRVKSPEQVILRSPDPVNWTVPLDTTKSFTVTQNIRDAPPSPRFRAGQHGDSRSGHHQMSGQQSSSGSTKASSPLSTFSSRSGLAQTHKVGQSLAKSAPAQTTGQKLSQHDKKSVLPGGGVEKKFETVSHNSTLNGYDDNKNKASKTTWKVENGKSFDKKAPSKLDSAPASGSEAFVRKSAPGPALPCLDDPKFMFDPPKTMTAPMKPNVPPPVVPTSGSALGGMKSPADSQPKSGVTSAPPVGAPRGAIRVLEAPTALTAPATASDKLNFVPPANAVATSKRPGVGVSQVSESLPQQGRLPSYHVLDAPDPTDYSTTTSTGSPGTGGKSKGPSAIEKARTRLDKFWGKSKDGEK